MEHHPKDSHDAAGPVRTSRWSAAVAAVVSSVLCAGVLQAVAQTRWGQERMRRASARWTARPPGAGIGIWRTDSRLGFTHAAPSSGIHTTPEFSVTYTIDEAGCRSTPEPADGEGNVLFLGDSFTFGHGVANAQAYPAVLASEYWPRVKVRNCAVMGWSTGQAHLALERALAAPPLPAAVFYGWTAADLRRNHLRRSWLAVLDDFGRRNTHFELEDGRLEYRGTAGPELGVPDDAPGLEEREAALTRSLIGNMARLCAGRGVRFEVLLLAARDPHDPLGDWLARHGAAHGIEVLDLRGVRGPYFKNDGHPKPGWHRSIARALAGEEWRPRT